MKFNTLSQRPSLRTTLALSAVCLILSCFGLVPTVAASAASISRVVLAGHAAPQALKNLTLVGRLTSTKTLSLDLVLPLRDKAGLEDLIRRQSDPSDALYGKYLTPQEFTERFGPSVTDLGAVTAFAKAQGLTIKEISNNRAVVSVTGPVSAVESAFGVMMQSYTDKAGHDFYAPATEPTIPASLSGKLLAVVGLHHVGLPRAFSRRVTPRPSSFRALPPDLRPIGQANYSGNAGLSPTDIRTIYNLTNVNSRGSGQTLALYELDTYTPSDIATYKSFYGIPNVALQNVGVNGFNTGSAPGGAAAEVTLDIEMFLALAPSAGKIIVYETDGGSTAADFETANVNIFTKFATDDLASVLSVSYGLSEIDVTQAEATANNQALMQCETQGQTVCVASGDAGAYTDQSNYPNDLPNTSEPGSQPLVTSVGGTDVTDSANPPYTYVSETSWADPFDFGRGNDGTGGGGGISQYWTLPSYQNNAFSPSVNPQGSTTMRNVPDVSLYGDYDDGGYDVYFTDPTNGAGWGGYNGTSAACPLWAAFLADIDGARLAAGKPKLGLANTAIYATAKQSSKYANDFHDINDSSNNLYYNAVNGYDNSTGWGSFNGINLFNDLVNYGTVSAPTITSFSPTSGPVGTSVIITGTNFTGVTSVKFNGTASTTFAANSSTQIQAIVPTGATTGKITVTISGGTATSSATFTVTTTSGVPTITGFSPTSGPVGTTVVITGTNLTGATVVGFQNAHATSFTVNSSTQITTSVPSGAATGPIAVATPSGTAHSGASFTVTTASGPPTITSFTPTSGPVGTTVVITGTNFTGATVVGFQGAHATSFTVNSSTQITTGVPSGAATGPIAVATPSGTVHSSATFTVTTGGSNVPTITSFSPASGPVGAVVVITGTNFASTSGVKFNGVAATGSINSNTQLTVTVPSGATTGKITVTTSNGTATSSTNFTVTASGVTIMIVNPTAGKVGSLVTISGMGFTGATAVNFNGVPASYVVNSATQVTAIVPAGATTGPVSVTAPAGTATSPQPYTVTF